MAPPRNVRFQRLDRKIDPGMSRAMAGNTGLTGLTEGQVQNIVRGQKNINQFTGDSRPVTFQSVGRQFGEVGSKYRRPADKQRFANEMSMLNKGIAAGGNFFVGSDGVPRFSFTNTGVKDPETGATVLSKQLPRVTATAPTMRQVAGDIGRAFTGFDSLKFVDPSMSGPMPAGQNRNMAFMQRTPGMAEGFIPFVSGAMKIGEGIKGIAQKAIDFGKQFAPDVGGVSDFFRPAETDLNARILALSPAQRSFYDRLVSGPDNVSVQEALRRAEAMGMAMGGIATLQ